MSETSRHAEIIRSMAVESCQKLFAEYRCPLQVLQANQHDATPLASHGMLSWSAPGLRGRLVLGCSDDVLGASNPVEKVPGAEWIAELTNQLIGRIKNQCLLHGVEIQVGPPICLRDLRTAEIQTQGLPAVSFRRSSAGLARLWLDLRFGRGFHMSEHPDPSRAGAKEGGGMLF